MSLDGHSTDVVKINAEAYCYYNLGAVDLVGKFVFAEPGSGTWTPTVGYTLPVAGEDLAVRANQAIESEEDIGITIVGTDQDDGALTGTATIEGRVAEGMSYEVTPGTPGKKFKTITSITCSNGVLGDGFDVGALPDIADDVAIAFMRGMSINPGKEVLPIYDHYDLDHNKRIRGDKSLSFTTEYTNAKTGIPRIYNRDVTLIVKFCDDGGNLATEVRYLEICRLSVPLDVPADANGITTVKGDGTYGKMWIFN